MTQNVSGTIVPIFMSARPYITAYAFQHLMCWQESWDAGRQVVCTVHYALCTVYCALCTGCYSHEHQIQICIFLFKRIFGTKRQEGNCVMWSCMV